MILLDFSQTMFGHIAMELARTGTGVVQEDYIRYMILNQVRALNKKHRDKFGQMAIVYDSTTGYWRKDVFPGYKYKRRGDRDADANNWEQIFAATNKIKSEIEEFIPMHTINVDGAEADDIIGFASHTISAIEPILIISSDKDFKQLHFFKNVSQYNPVKGEFMRVPDPKQYLAEMLVRGDKGDGIPNIFSPMDSIVNDVRATPCTAKRLANALAQFDVEHDITTRGLDISFIDGADEDVKKRVQFNYDLICLSNPIKCLDPKMLSEIAGKFQKILTTQPKDDGLFKYIAGSGIKSMANKLEDFYRA